jgi:hypothetical protein
MYPHKIKKKIYIYNTQMSMYVSVASWNQERRKWGKGA